MYGILKELYDILSHLYSNPLDGLEAAAFPLRLVAFAKGRNSGS